MVFGLFKKKKKVPQDGAQETTKPEKVSKSSKTKEKTPKNSKQTPKTETQQHPTEPQRVQDDNEDVKNLAFSSLTFLPSNGNMSQ